MQHDPVPPKKLVGLQSVRPGEGPGGGGAGAGGNGEQQPRMVAALPEKRFLKGLTGRRWQRAGRESKPAVSPSCNGMPVRTAESIQTEPWSWLLKVVTVLHETL
jgi:hypothetical protein